VATYIMLLNYTDQGIRNIRESPKRLDQAKQLLKSMGGELKQVFLTMGSHDLVVVCDAPNDEVIAKYALLNGIAGNVRTTTLKAFNESDFRKIVDSLG
jgi:uncharacterized protein with GYD domain